jgi:hypothetical protein
MAKRVDAKTQKAQKEKREKIILGVLLAALAIVAAIRVPGMLKSGGSGVTTAATPTTSLPVMTSSGPGSTSGGSGLTGDQQYIPSDGQLAGLERLSGGNPFRVEPGASAATGAASSSSTSTSASTTGTSTNPSENLPQPYLSATLSVNDVREEVNVRAQFPASSPFFVLVSAAAKSVKISIAGGSLANGASSITIKKGESVTLANTADGTQFTIALISTSKKAATTTSTSTSATSTSGSPPPPTVP